MYVWLEQVISVYILKRSIYVQNILLCKIVTTSFNFRTPILGTLHFRHHLCHLVPEGIGQVQLLFQVLLISRVVSQQKGYFFGKDLFRIYFFFKNAMITFNSVRCSFIFSTYFFSISFVLVRTCFGYPSIIYFQCALVLSVLYLKCLLVICKLYLQCVFVLSRL